MQKVKKKKKAEIEIKVVFEASRQAQENLINAYEKVLPSIGRKAQAAIKQEEVEVEAEGKRKASK